MTESIQAMGGMMSADAMAQMKEKMFTKLDGNSDGSLDRAEMESFAEELSQKTGQEVSVDEFVSSLDTDGDGVVSQDEFMAGKPPKPPEKTGNTTDTFNQYQSRVDGNDTTQTLLDMLSESDEDESINILA